MFSNHKLKKAVRLSLGIGAAALAVSAAPGAMAQGVDSSDEPLEEIITTGSRIKRADLESASPVTVLDREDILAAGITDVGNLIQRMPSMSGTPLGTTTNNGNSEEGIVQIDLRGMGVDRTVTLINGKRSVDGGDYTTIPAIMIERVEILKDGASAVYGADAVAGVVNIITRRDFEGLNIDVQNAAWFDTDNGVQNALSFIAGASSERGNFVFGAEYIDQEEAFQRDTPWAFLQGSYYIYYPTDIGCEVDPSNQCTFFGSSRIPESRLQFYVARDINDNGTPMDPSDDFPNPGDHPGNGRFLIPSPGAVMTAHDGRTYNYAPVNYMQTPYERLNYFGEGNVDIGNGVQFTASFRANNRTSAQELAPLPYDSNIDPSFSGSFLGTPYSGLSEDNFYLVQAIDAYNAANGTALPYEPLSNVRRRMTETPRHFSQDLTQYQATFGFNGTFNDMDWDVYYNTGKRDIVNNDLGQFSGVRLSNAMGPSADLDGDGTPECYGDISDPSTLIVGCVPLNFFGGEGTISPAMLNYVGVELVDTRIRDQEIWGASITGSAFELPGGELGWAAGVGYRADQFKYTPDSAKALGLVTGGTGQGTDGSLYSTSFFGEVYAPFFDNGDQSFAVTAGVRYDDYNLFGDDTTWQLGIEFQAIESVKLRATAGTAFRAPSIEELFDGLGDDAPTYADPCDASDFSAARYGGNGVNIAPGCQQEANRTDTQTKSLIGGNPDLTPETADTYTAGVVFTPEIGEGDLSVTLDYWKIDLVDSISSFGVQFTLDQCYVQQVQASCDLITRRNDADFTIRDIIDRNVNLSTQSGEGVDLEVRYAFDTSVGQFEAALLWAHLLERSKVARPGAPEQDLTGTHTNTTAEDGGTYAEDKANFSLHYNVGDLSVGYLAEYISAIDAPATFVTYTQPVDSYLYHDLVFDYALDVMGTTKISAGFTNLTDEAPPYIDPGFNATTDPNTYRVFGRGYFVRLSQTFE